MATLDNNVGGVQGLGLLTNNPVNAPRPIQPYQYRLLVSPNGPPGVIRITSKPDLEGHLTAQRNSLLYETLGRKYNRKYTVYTNNAHFGSVGIATTIGIPFIGCQYPYGGYGDQPDIYATCVDVKIVRTQNQKIWDVEAIFDTDRLVAFVTDNPLLQPAEISWDSQPYEFPMRYDVYGVTCVSSSGNAFDPPPNTEQARTLLRITRNESINRPNGMPGVRWFDPDAALQYRRKLNANKPIFQWIDPAAAPAPAVIIGRTPYFGQEQGDIRMNYINAHRLFTNGMLYMQVTYELEFRNFPDTFVENLLDQDFRRSDTNDLIRSGVTQQPFQNQTPLNGRGVPAREAIAWVFGGLAVDARVITIDPVLPALASWTRFPKAPKPPNADGIVIGPDQYFYIRIDDEVMQVVGGANTGTWTVIRAQKGTTALAHSASAVITLEPYFLRFLPYRFIDFTPLELESIR